MRVVVIDRDFLRNCIFQILDEKFPFAFLGSMGYATEETEIPYSGVVESVSAYLEFEGVPVIERPVFRHGMTVGTLINELLVLDPEQ